MPPDRSDPFSLRGRGIGLSGGGGHLGSAMALAMAQRGGTVVVIGRRAAPLRAVEKQAAQEPGAVLVCEGDVNDPETLARAAALLDAEGLALDGWINNAYDGPRSMLGDDDGEGIRESIDASLSDAIVAAQRAHALMRGHAAASIVNVASMYGLVSPAPSTYADAPQMHSPPGYGAGKAGLIQFTRYAAVHWAADGVRVNALVPGPFPQREASAQPGFLEKLAERVPLGRVGEPHEIGGAAVFLISEASSFMTGQQLVVDGGWTAW